MFKPRLTERGLFRVDFLDRYNKECSLQKSSIATEDCIWLGADSDRMHLTRNQVADLLPYLERFAETGELFVDQTNEEEMVTACVGHDDMGCIIEKRPLKYIFGSHVCLREAHRQNKFMDIPTTSCLQCCGDMNSCPPAFRYRSVATGQIFTEEYQGWKEDLATGQIEPFYPDIEDEAKRRYDIPLDEFVGDEYDAVMIARKNAFIEGAMWERRKHK